MLQCSAVFLLLLLEMGALPPAFPCVPRTSLTLLSVMLNIQQLCKSISSWIHTPSGAGTCYLPFQNTPSVLASCLTFLPV